MASARILTASITLTALAALARVVTVSAASARILTASPERFPGGGGQHRGDGVFDRITWRFAGYIWGYRASMRPRVLRLIDDHGPRAELVILSSRRATRRFVAQTGPRLP